VQAWFARELERELAAANAELAALTAERNAANAKVTELATVCEAAQFLIIRRNKTLDVIIEELETARPKIKTLESKVNELEDEINDLYYQQAHREEMN
jgi:chromosome segregation ATPase